MDGEGSKVILGLKEENKTYSSYKDITPLDLPKEDEIDLRKPADEMGWESVCLNDNEPPSRSISSNGSANSMKEVLRKIITLQQEQHKEIQALLQARLQQQLTQNQALWQQHFTNLGQEVGKRLCELQDECARRGDSFLEFTDKAKAFMGFIANL